MIKNVIKIGGSIFSNAFDFDKFYKYIYNLDENSIIILSAFGKSTQSLRKIAYKSLTNFNVSIQLIDDFHYSYHELAKLISSDFKIEFENKINEYKNQLLNLVKGINLTNNLSLSILDLVLSYGETYSYEFIKLLCKYYNIEAEFLDARELIITDENFGNAIPLLLETETLIKNKINNSNSKLFFIQGFVASTKEGKTTTMGFESSNLTATILAKAFDIKQIEIITDVEAIRNADPKYINITKLIKNIDYNFAYQLAKYGLNLLFKEMILLAQENNIKIKISSLNSNSTTTIYKNNVSNDKILVLDINSQFGEVGFESLSEKILILEKLNILNLDYLILDSSICFCYQKGFDFKKIKFNFKKKETIFKINIFNIGKEVFEIINKMPFILEINYSNELTSLILISNDISKTLNDLYNKIIID